MEPGYADRVVARMGGDKAPAAGGEPDDDEGAAAADTGADAEMGNQLKSALKLGDGAAICEAVRRIAGG